jgi:hypothetical protein
MILNDVFKLNLEKALIPFVLRDLKPALIVIQITLSYPFIRNLSLFHRLTSTIRKLLGINLTFVYQFK